MAVEKVDNSVESLRTLQENVKLQEKRKEGNPALNRLAAKDSDPSKDVHQAYDRMHHKHNRS